MNLDGFDYASFLKKKLLVGEVDPWRRTDKGDPIYGLLTSVDNAILECSEWSGQEISRSRFVDYLKLNDILVLRDASEFKDQIKKFREKKKEDKKPKRKISEERREELRKQMENMNKEIIDNSSIT